MLKTWTHMKKTWSENPLLYWKSRIQKFPILGMLARRVFVIRPSQAPVESKFSLARFEMEGRKHQMGKCEFCVRSISLTKCNN